MDAPLTRLNNWFALTNTAQRAELARSLNESVVWIVLREEHIVKCVVLSASASLMHAFVNQDVLHQSRLTQLEFAAFLGSTGFSLEYTPSHPVRVYATFFDLSRTLLKTLRKSPSVGYSDFPPLNGVALCVCPDPFVPIETKWDAKSSSWDQCARSRSLPWKETRSCTKFRVSLTMRAHAKDDAYYRYRYDALLRALLAARVIDATQAIHPPDSDWVRAVLSAFNGHPAGFDVVTTGGYILSTSYDNLTLLRAVCVCTPHVEHTYLIKDGTFHMFSDTHLAPHNSVQLYTITRSDGGAFVVPYLYVVC